MPSRTRRTPAQQSGQHSGHTSQDNPLRSMPSVEQCLSALPPADPWPRLARNFLVRLMRQAQGEVRAALARGAARPGASRQTLIEAVHRKAAALLAADSPPLRHVVNATGVVIHTNLGRAPLAKAAIDAMVAAADNAVNLEYDLNTGNRGDRDSLVEAALRELCAAQAATVVNNNAAAVMIALSTLAAGREVVISRGELIEIGGSFRMPDVMAASGARIREVGTTNRTHPSDFENAIGPDTALLLKVHPSNYRVMGFTAEVSLAETVAIGRRHGIPVMEDLGSGALIDLRQFGLSYEPVVQERIAAGADLVTFSGDKLLGGPQAGLIVGNAQLVNRIKKNPLKRALRCGKLTLAALSATLDLYRRSPNLALELPTLRLLTRPLADLQACAGAARDLLRARLGTSFTVEIRTSSARFGSGSLPGEEVPSVALRITHPKLAPEAIAAHFRNASPPVIGRISEGAFLLDFRAIEDPAALAVDFSPFAEALE